MKTTAKEKSINKGVKKNRLKPFGLDDANEIKPDFPLIEKDEVKQAEEKLRKAVKKKT